MSCDKFRFGVLKLQGLKRYQSGRQKLLSEDRQDHGQQNEMKDKHWTHSTTLKTKAKVTWNLQKLGWVQVLRKGQQLLKEDVKGPEIQNVKLFIKHT